MNNVEALDKVIANLIAKMETEEVGSDQHKALVDAVTRLEDRAIEMKRVEQDAVDKAKAREREMKNDILENNLKCQQLDDERVDRVVKNILTALGIVLPIGLTVWGTKVSFKFEEEGTITTTLGRGFINRLLGKK